VITRWHVDNDLSFAGPDVESFAAELVEQATSRVPYDSDTNPVAERQLGTVKRATMAALAYAGAPAVLCTAAEHSYNIAIKIDGGYLSYLRREIAAA
jgi:hypothetical protein